VSIPVSRDPEEARELYAALVIARERGLARQYDSFDELITVVSSSVEPTALRAKLTEFLPTVAGYVFAMIPPSARFQVGIWHAMEIRLGGHPAIAVFLVRSAEELAAIQERSKEKEA
jgi:hypothetical protein